MENNVTVNTINNMLWWWRVSVCVCVCERERESVCVCVFLLLIGPVVDSPLKQKQQN